MLHIVRTDDIGGGEPRTSETRIDVLDDRTRDVSNRGRRRFTRRITSAVYGAPAYSYDYPETTQRLRQEQWEPRAVLAEQGLQPPRI